VHYNSKSKIATWQLFLFEVPYMGKYGLFVADKKAKFWILVSLLSLLVWIIRLIPDSLGRFYNIVFVSWDYYYRAVVGGWMYSLAAIGIIVRLIGVVIGIAVLFLVWKHRSFFDIKKWVAAALCLESIYYLLLIPSPIWLFALVGESRASYAFGISYVLQIIFTVPFLIILAIKILKHQRHSNISSLLKWVGITFFGYIVALWANSAIRWLDRITMTGASFFSSEANVIGSLTAIVLMSLAVGFSVIAAFYFAKQSKKTIKWLALSLTMVGLYYTIYAIFSYLTGTLNTIWLVDIWTIPLLGLGLTLIISKPDNSKNVIT